MITKNIEFNSKLLAYAYFEEKIISGILRPCLKIVSKNAQNPMLYDKNMIPTQTKNKENKMNNEDETNIKSLNEFRRNPRSKGEDKKNSSVNLPVSYLKFVKDNELSLSAILKTKIEELMAKSKREIKAKKLDML